MQTKPRRPFRYDPKGVSRGRSTLFQFGAIAVVAVFALGLFYFIVVHGHHNNSSPPGTAGAEAIRVASPKLITAPGTTQPKAVLTVYEDFLCPICGNFEQVVGSTVNNLIDTGAVAADYHMVAILDRGNRDYSSRAGAAAYCVADQSVDAFRRFHAALYAQQPSEQGSSFPDNARLIEIARESGAGGNTADCINSGKYIDTVKSMADAAGIKGTPTIRINGQDWNPPTVPNGDAISISPAAPQQLIDKVKAIVGDVPGLVVGTSAPSPSAPAPGTS